MVGVGLLERISAARGEKRFAVDQYISDSLIPAFTYNGVSYPLGQTRQIYGQRVRQIASTLPAYMNALRASPPAFAAQMVRGLVLSQMRFTWRNPPSHPSTPRRTFGNAELGLLERPWTHATTGDLVTTMEWHEGLTGNAFVVRQPNRLRVLRPDWCGLVFGSDTDPDLASTAIDGELVGLVYQNGGLGGSGQISTLLPDEYAHWAPIPDPECPGVGQSWVTAALRDIQGDQAATQHKLHFFVNGATPNMVVKGIPAVSQEQFDMYVAMMESKHAGVANAYKTLYLTAGADATVVGADLKQLDFKATQGAGEPLALDTPIPTPTGWTTMGEIRVGDQVIGRDGRAANVRGTSPIHLGRDCYRVTLKDGSSVVADASHLWVAVDRGSAKRGEKTYTTQELFDLHGRGFANGVGGYRLALPAAPVVELPEADLLVDPYVLGAWLGDGQTAGAAICGATEDLKFIAHEVEQRGYSTTRWATAADKVDVIGVPGGLLAALRALGVLGGKRIPVSYLRASAGQRLDLLRGLMDTDGSIDDTGRGGCEYSSKDERLARQVVELLRSLGYRVTIKNRPDNRSRTGEHWRVHFRVAQDRIPFLLPRKADRALAAGEPHYSDQRSIVSIEPVPSVPVRCIAVDTEDHLFLAGEGFVPTHNTRIAMLGRVPAPLLGISEGLAGSSLNAGNFGMARRIFADSWIYPSLQDLAASVESIMVRPRNRAGQVDAELWFDTGDMPILREDAKDAAEIAQTDANTIGQLVRDGFTADSAKAAVIGRDMSQLVHTGLVSVQLQEPGSTPQIEAPTGGAA